jgi:hypothetical protein
LSVFLSGTSIEGDGVWQKSVQVCCQTSLFLPAMSLVFCDSWSFSETEGNCVFLGRASQVDEVTLEQN